MISYALAACAFGTVVTESVASAVRKSKFRNFEPYFGACITDDEQTRLSRNLTKQLMQEGVFHPASVHLPFQGGGLCWDPSALDEAVRREVSARFIKLIRDHADLMGPMVTIHASNEPPLSEHPQRIGQVCKTLEEMLPTARELGFVINVELLPRTCVGNTPEELMQIVSRFDPEQVGICMDVNHVMTRYRELPAMIDYLAPRIRSFHISDYDGIDETHWLPGQGLIDWIELMRHIRAIDHDLLLILETGGWQLKHKRREIDPQFVIRQNENACWFVDNCERLQPEMGSFRLPGN